MGVPLSELEGSNKVRLNRELVVYDRDWQPVFYESIQVEEKASASTAALMVDLARAPLVPGGHFVAVQVRDPVSNKVQLFKGELDVEGFGGKSLALSDLELAGDITEAQSGDKFQKGDVRVVPMPSKTFLKGQSVFLYYEVYHLTRDTFGQTRYQVDYMLRGQDTGSVGARILGGLGKLLGQAPSRDGLKISYEHTSEDEREPVYIELDVSSVTRPQVDLMVTVTDLNRQTKVAKTIRFFVVDTVSISGDQESE